MSRIKFLKITSYTKNQENHNMNEKKKKDDKSKINPMLELSENASKNNDKLP